MFLTILLLFLSVRANKALKDINDANINIENYTSCEQFVANTTFDPKSVIDIDWMIFYFWNPIFEDSYNIKFSLASEVVSIEYFYVKDKDKNVCLCLSAVYVRDEFRGRFDLVCALDILFMVWKRLPAKTSTLIFSQLVDRFRVELDGEIKPPVNWNDSILFMETSIDFSALLVKTNVSGIVRLIPSLAFEYPRVPELIFALKVVEPGYLGFLNCKYRLCYALAPVDKMPNHDYLTEEAQKLGFWSDFGRTHTAMVPPFPTLPPEPYNKDDDDEDEDMEMLHDYVLL
ncbi:hypothetical protein HF086_006554 [Spodoptera exigua]|uniref:Uncharacterized protein n=1 Tax=Spodoptera exigua TaxID=7107 RepID=A0A922MVE1_SPOEX|nr:hypothetical protein HF086_006554 [Spodoptera exigua]